MRIIFVEMTGFYTSCEGSGAGPRLAVMRNNVCWDVSEEAYDCGVRAGDTRRQAVLACPGIAFTGYHRSKYVEASRRFLEVLYSQSPVVEPVDLHQAFFDIPGGADPGAVLEEIRGNLHGLCFMVRAGVASSKFAARAASMSAASMRATAAPGVRPGVPAGTGPRLCASVVHDEVGFLEELPIEFLWKVPLETRAKAKALGLKRLGDLKRISRTELERQFGPQGAEIYRLARGEENDPVLRGYPPQEIKRSASFEGGADSIEVIDSQINALCRKASEELKGMGCGAGRIRLDVVLGSGRGLSASRRFPCRRWSPEALRMAARSCFESLSVTAPVEEISVTVDEIGRMEQKQMLLTVTPCRSSPDGALETALSSLGEKYRGSVVSKGRDFKASRREMLLSMWDPLRSGGRGFE